MTDEEINQSFEDVQKEFNFLKQYGFSEYHYTQEGNIYILTMTSKNYFVKLLFGAPEWELEICFGKNGFNRVVSIGDLMLLGIITQDDLAKASSLLPTTCSNKIIRNAKWNAIILSRISNSLFSNGSNICEQIQLKKEKSRNL